MEHYAEIKERLVAKADVAIVGVDDGICAGIAQKLRAQGRTIVPISILRRSRMASCWTGRASSARPQAKPADCRSCRHPVAAWHPQWPECRRGGCGPGERMDTSLSLSRRACGLSRASRTGWRRSAGAERCSTSTIPRRPMPMPPKRRCSSLDDIYLDPRRAGQGGRYRAARPLFPKVAKAYLIGEAANPSPKSSAKRFLMNFAAPSSARSIARPGMRRRARRLPHRPALARLRLVRSIPEFREARRQVSGGCSGQARGAAESLRGLDHGLARRTLDPGELVVDHRPLAARRARCARHLRPRPDDGGEPAGRRAPRPADLPFRQQAGDVPRSFTRRLLRRLAAVAPACAPRRAHPFHCLDGADLRGAAFRRTRSRARDAGFSASSRRNS